jgi:hypothetical protein
MLDLNLYKGFVEDTIFYKDAFIDGEKVSIYLNFDDLTYFPNPITFTFRVKFGFQKNGGFIQYECKNIDYNQLFFDKFKLILKCIQVSGMFNDSNVGNAHLVIDSNIIDFNSVLENLINSLYHFSVDNQFYTFDGSLFETNLEDIDSYINIVKNSKIINIDQCEVAKLIDNLNYSYLNITDKPLVKIETINDSEQNNQKDYNITLTFLEKTIEQLGERNLQLLLDDILFSLFNTLDLVFFANIIEFSSPESNLKIRNTNTGTNTTFSLTTNFNKPPLCVTSTTTKSGNYPSVYVAKGAKLILNGDLTVDGSFINEGTITGSYTINIIGSNKNGCTNVPPTALPYSNYGTINLCPSGQFSINNTSTFQNNGTITAASSIGTITGNKLKTCE